MCGGVGVGLRCLGGWGGVGGGLGVWTGLDCCWVKTFTKLVNL